jgi:uncharacterized protein with HEPN domain
MYDRQVLLYELSQILEALEQIPRRTIGINQPEDFRDGNRGRDSLDGVLVIFIACGEAFKHIDKVTASAFLPKYKSVDWRKVIGLRDVIAHHYFDVDVEQIFAICQHRVPLLIETVRAMIADVRAELNESELDRTTPHD